MPEAFGFSVPTEVEQLADPSRTAVIIYDMQVGIISQIREGAAVLKKCVELVAAARGSGYRIFFTRHMWLPLRAAGVGQLRRAMIWQRTEDSAKLVTPFLPGSGPWQIAGALNPGVDDVLIDKITMSAFMPGRNSPRSNSFKRAAVIPDMRCTASSSVRVLRSRT